MRIDILIYDGCLGSEVFAFADTLMMAVALVAAGRGGAPPVFEIRLVSSDGKPRSLMSGIVQLPAAKPGTCDLLVIPGMAFVDREALAVLAKSLQEELAIIRRHWHSGNKVAAICVGSFLVVASGIAKDRRVATGWPVAHLLPGIDQSITVETSELVVKDGALTTTGAITSVYDLALDVVATHLSEDVATRLRRILLLEPHRLGQSAFARTPDPLDLQLTPVHRAKAYLRDNLSLAFDLTAVAVAAGVSVRSLQRNFKSETGITPLTFHQQLRIDRAKHLLEATRLTIGQIADEVGYSDEAAFRKLFRKMTDLTPGDFRRRLTLLRT
ncbi:MAG: GlxA family transcriptional regulator [Micrococcales bacterium]